MTHIISDIQCVRLPLNKSNFREEQLQEIAMAFMFSQLSIFQEFDIQGTVNLIGPVEDLLFSIEIEKPLTNQEYIENEKLFNPQDPLDDFQASLNQFLTQ